MLCIQDNCFEGSLHLDEVLLSSVPTARAGGAAFAFASCDGLNAVFGSQEFLDYYKYHRFTLVVGMDAVTNTRSLEKAKELVKISRGALDVRVYLTDEPKSIFHPKFAWFEDRARGGSLSIIGSGNLTLQGLQSNIEAFAWNTLDEEELQQTITTWDKWICAAEEAGRLFEITDDEVIERARLNSRRRPSAAPAKPAPASPAPNFASVLISGIPKQSGRGWTQFNMKKQYFEEYFGFSAESADKNLGRRILLQQVLEDFSILPAESRPGVISSTSSNYRIEFDGGRAIPNDVAETPFVAFAKTGDRRFRYQIVLPDNPVYHELYDFADKRSQSRPSNQLPKCIAEASDVKKRIPNLALLAAPDSEDDGYDA